MNANNIFINETKIIEDFMKIKEAMLPNGPKYNFILFFFFLKNSFVLNLQMVIAGSEKKLKRLGLVELLQTYVRDHNFFLPRSSFHKK